VADVCASAASGSLLKVQRALADNSLEPRKGKLAARRGRKATGLDPPGVARADRVAEEAELPNGEQPRTGKPVARLGRKAKDLL
jgi:hypothetical protein